MNSNDNEKKKKATKMDQHDEERQACNAEILGDIIDIDEENGGCSVNRPPLYQAAFAAIIALVNGSGSFEHGMEQYYVLSEHVDAEITRLRKQRKGEK